MMTAHAEEYKGQWTLFLLESATMSMTGAEAAASEHHKHVKVSLVWGGTGESKNAEVGIDDTAGQVFDLIYQRFHQQKSDQDTFEINGKDFPRSRFGETVSVLELEFGKELVFEVIPPTSGA